MTNDTFWQTKLHARLHDPAEKALVLLRDPEGHEDGTSRAVQRDLGFQDLPITDWLAPDNADVLDTVLFKEGIPVTMYRHVRRADQWAGAADRPHWPLEEITVTKNGEITTRKVADWAQVRWSEKPVLIHPLTGREIDLKSLAETDMGDIKQRSFDHFRQLIIQDGEVVDWQRTLLAFWRFGPELAEKEDKGELGVLWPLLPADTRVPDHSIWDHLDLTSAFAGAFAADPGGEAALLALSIGPVQGFIAAARSTSDLWAGSHLLSRLAWEAMKIVCGRLGPDAILFPRLRGVPQVDVWLRDEMGLPADWFKDCKWAQKSTDANPLFTATIPNRLVAVVPHSQGADIARTVSEQVRAWLLEKGMTVVDRLLEVAELKKEDQPRNPSIHAYRQMIERLRGFPEVHWALTPFSLIRPLDTNRETNLDTTCLSEAMVPFFGVEAGGRCGFLNTPAWEILQKDIKLGDRTMFLAPNPGVLYPGVYDLVERVLAAAKSVRPFEQTEQKGWRCSLTGETEWLTTDPAQLEKSYGGRTGTLWAIIAKRKPAWAKLGEHLGGLAAIKRLWPTLFAEEVAQTVGIDNKAADRFVVSTHTMALANQLGGWLEAGVPMSEQLRERLQKASAVALPRQLSVQFGDREGLKWARRLPGLLDEVRENDDEAELTRLEKLVRQAFKEALKTDDDTRIETYYALLLMDGDHMGRILSGDEYYAISYLDSFHPEVRNGFNEKAKGNPLIADYGKQQRALSPNRHFAISAALNDFALHLVPEVLEAEHLGRVIYCGGDDVLAMLPVSDLLSAMQRLRQAYSGTSAADEHTDWRSVRKSRKLVCKDGFAYLRGRLMRMMGERATASCGAVIAHHQAPLSAVLRQLREAERRAKNEGGRDAFSLTLIKRSGGASRLTAKWGEPLELLIGFRDFLTERQVSRRAVYNSVAWLTDLPEDANPEMIGELLNYQLERQTAAKELLKNHKVPNLCRRLAELACSQPNRIEWLGRFLSVAEFLARECRVS